MQSHLPVVHIYTDGSCLKNPNGPSGWAFIFVEPNADEPLIIGSQGFSSSTNNRMELTAILEALEYMENDIFYIIYTDSQWARKGAIGENKRKANLDLWSRFDQLSKHKHFEIVWIKAHNGNKYNEYVDSLAREEAKKINKLLF